MIDRFLRFLNNMDARAVRAVGVSVLLFASIALVFIMGRTTAIFDEDDAPLFNWLRAQSESPWGLPATVVVFTLAAFIGAPQFVLIAASVVAFGPMRGFAYSWLATVISAAVDFQLARVFGARILRRYGGDAINRLSQVIGKAGFWSSLVVRIVPSAPFIVVNMAAGASHMRFLAFLGGTGVGIIPKTALVAFAGGSVVQLAEGGGLLIAAGLAAVAAAWLVAVVFARRVLLGRGAPGADASAAPGEDASEPVSQPGSQPGGESR